jgi:predicted site-specific integrase-resolvase
MNNAIQILKEKNYVNTEEACKLLCISKMTLHKLEKEGLIDCIKYGLRKYYNIEEINKYLSSIII